MCIFIGDPDHYHVSTAVARDYHDSIHGVLKTLMALGARCAIKLSFDTLSACGFLHHLFEVLSLLE
jgi:hypothetical protein